MFGHELDGVRWHSGIDMRHEHAQLYVLVELTMPGQRAGV
jgi:hypothetical protein